MSGLPRASAAEALAAEAASDGASLRIDDAASLTAAYRAYHLPLTRYAHGLLGDGASAHDVVQDVFVQLWERRATLVVERSLSALLYTMTRNRALNVRRRFARTAPLDEAPEGAMPASPAASPDARLDADDLARRLRAWIGALPPRRHEAFTLSRFHDLSHAEIAEVMDLSVRTVDTHIVHALRDLRRYLDALNDPPGTPAPR